jgi:hypothetical protein
MIAHVRGFKQALWPAQATETVLQDRRGGSIEDMAEVFVEFSEPVTSKDGRTFVARACGAEMDNARWQGWIEFIPVDGGAPLRSGRETTQPNRTDTAYWATGLTAVYLEGALNRALGPSPRTPLPPVAPPLFDGPAEAGAKESVEPTRDSVLNPFSVYRNGESMLRRQLGALSGWHLVNIIEAYGLSDRRTAELEATAAPVLAELIVSAVQKRTPAEASVKP